MWCFLLPLSFGGDLGNTEYRFKKFLILKGNNMLNAYKNDLRSKKINLLSRMSSFCEKQWKTNAVCGVSWKYIGMEVKQ